MVLLDNLLLAELILLSFLTFSLLGETLNTSLILTPFQVLLLLLVFYKFLLFYSL